MNKKLKTYIQKVILDIDKIPDKRKKLLSDIVDYIKQGCLNENRANIIFICTHNSRRSQLAQCWSIASYQYYKLKNIKFFSGGLEITSFNLNALNALKRSGFIIDQKGQKEHIKYTLQTCTAEEITYIFRSKIPLRSQKNIQIFIKNPCLLNLYFAHNSSFAPS